jgi:hypothetical protein
VHRIVSPSPNSKGGLFTNYRGGRFTKRGGAFLPIALGEQSSSFIFSFARDIHYAVSLDRDHHGGLNPKVPAYIDFPFFSIGMLR